jgi:hypothetical protein
MGEALAAAGHPRGTGRAQPRQRATGGAKRITQASHTGREGQARHMAH